MMMMTTILHYDENKNNGDGYPTADESQRKSHPTCPAHDKKWWMSNNISTSLTLMWKKIMLATVMASEVRLLPVLQWNTKAWWLLFHASFVPRKLNRSCWMASNSCTSYTRRLYCFVKLPLNSGCVRVRARERAQTHTHTHKYTGTRSDWHTDRHKCRQTDTQMEIETHINVNTHIQHIQT